MRKIITLTALITLFGAGALAHARDITTTETETTAEAPRSAVRGEEYAGERHHREADRDRRGHREHHDESRERHDAEHGRRH